MNRFFGILALATLSAAQAQYTDPASQSSSSNPSLQSAPIVQGYQGAIGGPYSHAAASPQLFETQPSAGVYVRGDVANGVETVSSGANTELRVVQGRADITVHHPANHSEITVDLPGGQVSLLKDGLYTFNAQTNTVRVLHGEAEAGGTNGDKGIKVKETQQLAFFPNAKLKAVNAYPYELTADLLAEDGHGDGRAYGGSEGGYYGPYPYYAGFYPYGFYPYGYGYPFGVGIGFGYGGFYRGGFGGYYRGGFRR